MKVLKRIGAAVAATAMVSMSAMALSTSVVIDGKTIQTSGNIENGVTYVPVRCFFDELGGYSINWDAKSMSACVDGSSSMTFTSGSSLMTANGAQVSMSGKAGIRDGVMSVPLRAVAVAAGYDISYDQYRNSVSMTSKSGYDSDSLYWLSRIISAESKGESLNGQIAVGNVIMNRVYSKDFPSSIYDVIFDKNYGVQFTPVSNGTIYDAPSEQSVTAAKMVLDGYDVSKGCLYFFNPKTATNSSWIVQNRQFCKSIGNHDFYY